MHWVNRGPEPDGLEDIRTKYTPSWIKYYRRGLGAKPRDSLWRTFLQNLAEAFDGLCAYCEERARGEVDHFRPKCRFPEFVYCWSNWMFACRDCNQAKGAKWPIWGFVDPCARSKPAHPDSYFIFDTQTGEILADTKLTPRRRNKAQRTIEQLQLNELHHLKKRRDWLRMVSAILPGSLANLSAGVEAEIKHLASRSTPFSSITRAYLSEEGYQLVN